MSEAGPHADLRKIAVVAVHGVANPQPAESARALTALLFGSGDDRPGYSSFRETPLRILQRKVRIASVPGPRPAVGWLRNWWNERPAFVVGLRQGAHFIPREIREPDYQFMRAQLESYEADGVGASYETVRLEGQKLGDDGRPILDVHVHEIYWADVSRLGTGIVRFFGELYQLFFHVASLGRQAVDWAGTEMSESRRWWVFGEAHGWAVRMLTIPVALLNLVILAVAVAVAAVALPDPWKQPTAALGMGAVCTVAVGAIMAGQLAAPRTWAWLGAPLFAGAFGTAIGYGFVAAIGQERMVALEALLLADLALLAVIRVYDARRPGAFGAGCAFVTAATAVFASQVAFSGGTHDAVFGAGLRTVQVLLLALHLAWVGLLAFALIAMGAGAVAVRATEAGSDRRTRVQNAAWTARATLAFPVVSFMILTISIWGALLEWLKWLVPEAGSFEPLALPLMPVTPDMRQFVEQLLAAEGGPRVLAMPLVMLLFVAVASWATLPSVLAERRPWPEDDPRRAERLGQWLTRGLGSVVWATELLSAGIALAAATVLVAVLRNRPETTPYSHLLGIVLIAALGVRRWRRGAYAGLDVLLDVDNYMRGHPPYRTPRAQIAERYVSLLRHLCRWRDERNHPYAAIVIVAHSQGTVITADLLRFLRHERDPELADLGDAIPIVLFTMGSPLRQLYARCFPHLYRWVDDPRRTTVPDAPAMAHDEVVALADDAAPDPANLGVVRWVNAYRSGDYIGRHLWLPDDHDGIWRRSVTGGTRPTVYRDARGTRREMCIGGGAHTHYWDATARDIAVELDRLVAEAASADRGHDTRAILDRLLA